MSPLSCLDRLSRFRQTIKRENPENHAVLRSEIRNVTSNAHLCLHFGSNETAACCQPTLSDHRDAWGRRACHARLPGGEREVGVRNLHAAVTRHPEGRWALSRYTARDRGFLKHAMQLALQLVQPFYKRACRKTSQVLQHKKKKLPNNNNNKQSVHALRCEASILWKGSSTRVILAAIVQTPW